MGKLKFLIAMALIIGRQAAAEEWPEFRGPLGMGISNATNVPAAWGAKSNVVWKTALPGRGWSSPVVSGGKIYLTTAVDEGLRAICLSAEKGDLIWNTEIFRPDQGAVKAIHKKNGLASPTPIVRDGRVYVHFGHMGTAALDLSGQIVWKSSEITYSPVHGAGGSPALAGDLLVFNCDAAEDPFVAALDARDGQVRWKTPRHTPAQRKFSFATPLLIDVGGEPQWISPGSGLVGAYDPASGRELWRVRYGEGYSVVTRPVYAHGLLYVSSSFDRPVVYAVKPGGRGDLTDSNVAWTQKKSAPNTPSLIVVGDEVYFVSDAGIATCADARSGEVHWTERLGGDMSASPVAAEGRVYFQNEAGIGYVVRAAKKFELISKNDLEERTLASAAVLDNALILRSEAHLWRLGTRPQ